MLEEEHAKVWFSVTILWTWWTGANQVQIRYMATIIQKFHNWTIEEWTSPQSTIRATEDMSRKYFMQRLTTKLACICVICHLAVLLVWCFYLERKCDIHTWLAHSLPEVSATPIWIERWHYEWLGGRSHMLVVDRFQLILIWWSVKTLKFKVGLILLWLNC